MGRHRHPEPGPGLPGSGREKELPSTRCRTRRQEIPGRESILRRPYRRTRTRRTAAAGAAPEADRRRHQPGEPGQGTIEPTGRRVTIAAGPTGPYTTGPAWSGGPLPGTGPGHAADLAALLKAARPKRQRAAMKPRPRPQAGRPMTRDEMLARVDRLQERDRQRVRRRPRPARALLRMTARPTGTAEANRMSNLPD